MLYSNDRYYSSIVKKMEARLTKPMVWAGLCIDTTGTVPVHGTSSAQVLYYVQARPFIARLVMTRPDRRYLTDSPTSFDET